MVVDLSAKLPGALLPFILVLCAPAAALGQTQPHDPREDEDESSGRPAQGEQVQEPSSAEGEPPPEHEHSPAAPPATDGEGQPSEPRCSPLPSELTYLYRRCPEVCTHELEYLYPRRGNPCPAELTYLYRPRFWTAERTSHYRPCMWGPQCSDHEAPLEAAGPFSLGLSTAVGFGHFPVHAKLLLFFGARFWNRLSVEVGFNVDGGANVVGLEGTIQVGVLFHIGRRVDMESFARFGYAGFRVRWAAPTIGWVSAYTMSAGLSHRVLLSPRLEFRFALLVVTGYLNEFWGYAMEPSVSLAYRF